MFLAMNSNSMTKTIIFLCHGNICRSPMAEFMMKDLMQKENLTGYNIISRATSAEEIGNDLYYQAKEILKVKGVPFTPHTAKRITREDIASAYLIIAMEHYNIVNLKRLYPDLKMDNVKLLNPNDISDPWYNGDFLTCYKEIEIGLKNLIKKLKAEPNANLI